MTHEERMARRKEIEDGVKVTVHSIPAAFDESTPGVPENPDEPKASEGMEAFRTKVYEAINARGWNIYMNAMAEYDFIIMELYDSSAICQDTLDGKYYKIPITTDADGNVSIGDPEEYDITYTPADTVEDDSDGPMSTAEPIATERREKFRYKGGKATVMAAKAENQKRPTYRVLLVQSGFTQDARYITRASLEDAVARNLFDGVKCYYQHPDPDDPHARRPGLPCGYVKPGSVSLENNKASEVDVWADIAILATDVGNSIRDVLDASLEIGVPLLGNSIYSKDVWQHTGVVHDRTCLIATKFEAINAVDFVTEAAFPRASVKSRLAASAQGKLMPKGSLTMDEKQELIALRKKVDELSPVIATLQASADDNKKKADRLELEKTVDADLSASGMTKDDQVIVRPILMSIADPDLRKAQMEMSKRAFLNTAKAGSNSGANGTDNGDGTKPELKPQRAELTAGAKAAGIKPEFIAQAQAQAS